MVSDPSRRIYELFIKPVVEHYYCDNHPLLSDPEYIIRNLFFHAETRNVIMVRAQKKFTLRGREQRAPEKLALDATCVIPKGTEIFVRFDKTLPDAVSVNFFLGTKEKNFLLSSLQWRRMRLHLVRNKRKHPALRNK